MQILMFGQLLYFIMCLDLRQVTDTQALCLDGSPGSYYYSKGSGDGKNKYLIHFEGGDWILGNTEAEFLQNAVNRQQTIQGSSINKVATQIFEGLLSEDAEKNPNFYNWNLIHINYCDGTGFQGMKSTPVTYNSNNIYFRGELIVISVFSKFREQFQEADTIILSGCSIGASASLLWSDYLAIIVPTNVHLFCIPDSGFMIDMNAIDGKQLLQTSLQIMNYLVDFESIILREKCALNFPNQTWKCFYIQNLLPYITTPIFIIQSLYDNHFLKTYLKINCVDKLALSDCTTSELTQIDLARDNLYNTINSIVKDSEGTGSFAPSCLSSCLFLSSAVKSDKWAIPENSGQNIYETLLKWIKFQREKNSTDGKIALIDTVFWPGNGPCAYQLSGQLFIILIYFTCILLQ